MFGLIFLLLGLGFVETVDTLGIVDALLVGTATWRRCWRSCASAWALTTKVGTSSRVAICATACSFAIKTCLLLRTVTFPLILLEAPILWEAGNIALALCVILIHPRLAIIEC